MFSIRFRFPKGRFSVLIIVIVFTVTLLCLGYEPDAVLMLIAGAMAVGVKAAQCLIPAQPKKI
ncbi:hypothetical protein GBF35_41140 [Nonomuraea phyllanthi]|uniref:hypothetical protein n=1 Tax=Nonomuraea phyllanthi TaxID=2219224 RepID=UPI001293FA8B|nr:hypothetical protein [Nonomuraea phyllanthi]QFY12134.1 hypothetical protein GBF35_41140 [Nonomuraea phyllanthi]